MKFFKEYYIGTKFKGIVYDIEKDREQIGYFGRATEILQSDVILHNKKKIKAGTEVMTIIYPY